MIRAFIAIRLPAPLLAGIEQLQRDCQMHLPKGTVRWTHSDHVHLTLRFLGNVPETAVSDLQKALPRACRPLTPFRLRAGGLGCFPNPQRPRIIWVGVEGDLDSLRQLQQNIKRETAAWGESEERDFRPHLTIGRMKDADFRQAHALKAALDALAAAALGDWTVDQVDLMQSELSPQGSHYTCLASIPLAAPPAL